jgi:pimeloyl-ACP methyl ester carboxylesterase
VNVDWKKKLLGTWSWKRPFVSLAWVYGIMAVVALVFGSRLLFRPPVAGYEADGVHFRRMEVEGKALGYVWRAPRDASSPVLFFSHGNAEDLADYEWLYEEWENRGYGVLAYDYPGYGISSGVPTEESVNEAALTAWQYGVKELGVDPQRAFLVGRSVGCGPTLVLAQKVPHAGVVLISPFTSAFKAATRVPMFMGDMFPNDEVIRTIKTPLLIMHGENDRVIPFSQGRSLYERSPSEDRTWLPLPACGHNDLFDVHYDLMLQSVDDFVRKHTQNP